MKPISLQWVSLEFFAYPPSQAIPENRGPGIGVETRNMRGLSSGEPKKTQS